MKIKVGNKTISKTSRPFVIAEVGVNHYDIAKKEKISLMSAAKLMIHQAASNGADAVKFQTYKAEKLASKFSPAYWDTSKEKTKSQYELFKNFDKFGRKEYTELAKYSKRLKIIFLSTPFDLEAVDILDPLVPAFKIASADITNIPLLLKVASKRKPVFFSTGASTLDEVQHAINVMRSTGNKILIPLHCTLNYPTLNENANLLSINYLQECFPELIVGYSDHTLPDERMMILTSAAAQGAKVIEKHFTLDKTLDGNDHYHAMDAGDLKTLSKNLDLLMQVMGKKNLSVLPSERISRKYARRSLVAARNIKKGEKITKAMLEVKRPGTGISPKDMDRILGKKARKNIKEDEILTRRMLG